jgi:acyl-CoA synthetase (AMP-forming)/AMP-acid ligase II
MAQPEIASDRARLRARWYTESFYSERTCIDAFVDAATVHAQAPIVFASHQNETCHTVGRIHAAAISVAAGLQRLGVRAGDSVAVQLTNRLECAIAYQAVLLTGAVLVPIVHIYGMAEVDFIVSQSRAKVLIMLAKHRSTSYVDRTPRLSQLPGLDHIVVVDAMQPDHGGLDWSQIAADRRDYVSPSAVGADDVCVLLYTSGTVSAPKGVQHSHNSLLAEQATLPGLLGDGPDDVHLVSFPAGHVGGMNSMLRPMIDGTRSVFLDYWDPEFAAELIGRFSVTSTSGTPFHLHGLLDVDDAAVKLTTLRRFLTGAATVGKEVGDRAEAAGIAAFRCYGMTEHPTVTSACVDDPLAIRMGSDGVPMRGCAVRIVNAEGIDQPTGVDGEVVVQGPDQFIGYQDPALDAVAFTADGWLRTGDLGRLDSDGRLTITDRIKDVIIRGGETISSGQIEDVLDAHPAVAEAVAVAAPDPRYGEVVAAVVVLRSGTELDLAELQRHFATSGLARQKTPERLVVVDALPRTAAGKVRKAEIRSAHFR